MIVKSQIKYWVFGAFGAIGIFLTLRGWELPSSVAIGITFVLGCVGASILGGVWDSVKEGEKAASYRREARDEEARQAMLKIKAEGAKNLLEKSEPPSIQNE